MAHASETTEPPFDDMLAAIAAGPLDDTTAWRTAPYAEFPVEDYRARYAKARRMMEEDGLDALLVTQDLNVRYFAGYLSILWCSRFRPYVALLPRDPSLGPTLILPAQEAGNAASTSWIADVVTYPDQDDPSPYIAAAIHDKLPFGRVGTELGFGQRLGMTINQFRALEANAENVQFVNGTPLIQAVRMVKSPGEVDRLLRACEISQAGVRADGRRCARG